MGKKLTQKQVKDMIYKVIHEKTKPYVAKYVKAMSQEIAMAVEMWYQQYTPERYRRTWSFKNFYKVNIKPIDRGYLVTHTFDPENMTPHYSWSPRSTRSPQEINQIVYNLDFLDGWHGGRGLVLLGEGNDTPPWDIIQAFHKRLVATMKLEW